MKIFSVLASAVLRRRVSRTRRMTDRMERYLETMMPVPGSPSYAEVAQGLEKANAKIADLETRLAAHADKERARPFMATAI